MKLDEFKRKLDMVTIAGVALLSEEVVLIRKVNP